ncbi:MAG: ATP-binding protein [Kofleriaceae bacterium]
MVWVEANREYLNVEIRRVAALFASAPEVARPRLPDGPVPALLALQQIFGLSEFERDVIAMCAGAALDPSFAASFAPSHPCFAGALAVLPEPHLDAISPTAPLRAHGLVVLGAAADPLNAPLALDERILHFVTGVPALDERLRSLRIPATRDRVTLVPSQRAVADRLARVLRDAPGSIAIQVFGGHVSTRAAIIDEAAIALGAAPLRLRASALASTPAELYAIVCACERESLLSSVVPVIELDVLDPPEAQRAARAFAEMTSGIAILSTADPLGLARTTTVQLEVPTSDAAERRQLWELAFGADVARVRDVVDRIADQFRLEYADIASIVLACDRSAPEPELGRLMWSACLERSRPRLDDLARRIIPTATWDDLVVPPAVAEALREIVEHLRYRHTVQERWGFARGDARGRAITALFAGPSGTGKTLAAEVVAREAGLDLYQVDLSQVVDKYIGETEKRLRRIYDSAEKCGAVLLFDEADALFGKRAEVERGADRWANLEVSYLLQRMEQYHGLAVLTTNAKDALDRAFLRRLRFVANFPFPDAALRLELWRRAFPNDAPTAGLDLASFARLQLSGANIKSVALKAAFHAAADAAPITPRHVLRAARSEYAKLELPFPETEVRHW